MPVTAAGVEQLERALPDCNISNIDREELEKRLEELRARQNPRQLSPLPPP